MLTPLPYLDRLDSARQEVLNKLAAFTPPFVLAGGTAIMLQIGHRLSYDFDNFSDKPLPNSLIRQFHLVFGNNIKPHINTGEVISFKTPANVEVTFVFHPFPVLRPIINTSGIPLFHLDDLAANKAYTIGRRGAWRDYVDIFTFLKSGLYTLENIIALANQKFRGEFHDKLFLEQLVYFDDVKIVPTVFLKDAYTPDEIKNEISRQVKQYLSKIL